MVRTTWGVHTGCAECSFSASCLRRATVSERPRGWKPGGLMLIAEGPSMEDMSRGRVLSDASGRLLTAILEDAGIDRERVWLTGAVLGRPPREKRTKGEAEVLWRDAAFACLPRLEAEIAEAKPRVIVTLGTAAFAAASGESFARTVLKPFICERPDCIDVKGKPRSLDRRGIQCALGDCAKLYLFPDDLAELDADPDTDPDVLKATVDLWRTTLMESTGGVCTCGASLKKLRPKRITCPSCRGARRKPITVESFTVPWSLHGREGVAGAVCTPDLFTGAWQEFGVRYIIPSYAPSACLFGDGRGGTGQFAARVMTEHLRKAARLLRTDAAWASDVEIVADAARFHEALSRSGDWAVDIETDSREGPWKATAINCIGFGHADSVTSFVVDTRGWSVNTRSPLMDAVHRWLVDAETRKVLHNGVFDRVVISRLWGIDTEGVVGDTLVEHNACYSDEEHTLGFVAHELTDAPPWKDTLSRNSWGRHGDKDALCGLPDFHDLAVYNARDTRATALVHQVLTAPMGRLHEARTTQVAELDQVMMGIAVRMELAGVHLDVPRLREVESAHVTVCTEELARMRAMVGVEDWTPTGKALEWALFADSGPLQLTPYGVTPTGVPATDAATLLKMADQHPFVPALLRWRKYSYALSHYIRGKGMELDAWDYLHPTWKVYGARTGRWSSSPNLQNWTTGDREDANTNMKSMVQAPPGRRFVGADYSQLELRVMAALSNDANLIHRCLTADEQDKLNPDADPHSHVALVTFGQTFLDADKARRKALRDVAKRVFYGLGYGAGAETVLASIYDGGYEGPPLSTRMVESVMQAIFREFPGIKVWREGAVRSAIETREVRSPLLHRRRIFPLGDVDVTVCYNYPIQSAGADIMNSRLAILADRLRAFPTADIFAQVHDAIYVECDEDDAAAITALVEESLTVELALVPGGQVMPFLATAHHSTRWDLAA